MRLQGREGPVQLVIELDAGTALSFVHSYPPVKAFSWQVKEHPL